MSALHGTLGWLSVGAAIVVTFVALATWLLGTRRPVHALALATDIVVAVVTAAVFATLFLGGLLLITGVRPGNVAHVIIGVAALAALPVAMGLGIWADQGGGRTPRRYLWVSGGGLVLTILAILLTLTG